MSTDKPKIILHIGTEKTGSTSLQRSLTLNAGALRAQGFIPFANQDGEPDGAISKTRIKWKQLDSDGWDALAAAVAKVKNNETLIISNESLYTALMGPPAEKLRRTFEGCDLKIFLYVREQASFLQSLALQNQKKEDRASDFTDGELIQLLIKRRPLDYHQLCTRIERVFGAGTVEARSFDREALAGGDIATDFFTAIGVENADQLLAAAPENGSLTVELAHALRTLPKDVKKRLRYGDLLDAALRLSYEGIGQKYFLSEAQVVRLRAGFARSNERFAREFLTNAEALTEPDVWSNGASTSTSAAQADLIALVRAGPKLGTSWHGGRQIGLRVFKQGWDTDIDESAMRVSIADEEAVLAFRHPFARRFDRKPTIALQLKPAHDTAADARATCGVSVNGTDLGSLDLLTEPIVLNTDLIDANRDLAEIRIRPDEASARSNPVWFEALGISHV